MRFHTLAWVLSLLCGVLCLVWLLAPQLLLGIWQVPASPEGLLLARRSAALFAGIGCMFFAARHAPPGTARRAMSSGMAIACLALAALGVFEWATNGAGPGIALAVVVELALALACLTLKREPART